jgi:ATP-binding cassette subfamily B protein
VRDADLIVALEQGTIAEIGSHGQLLARDGAYTALIRRQEADP